MSIWHNLKLYKINRTVGIEFFFRVGAFYPVALSLLDINNFKLN